MNPSQIIVIVVIVMTLLAALVRSWMFLAGEVTGWVLAMAWVRLDYYRQQMT